MIWSFSGHRIFIQCQRKWFFMKKVANALAKNDPLRREAYLLNQLRSLPAWRGGIVDKVIEEAVVPSLRMGTVPQLDSVLKYASDLADAQLQFAGARRYLEPGVTKSKAGNQYAALFEIEYGDGIDTQVLELERKIIETSLANLLSNNQMIETLLHSRWLGSQRALTFNLDGADFTIRAHPDLIAFFDSGAPLIVDWKVSTSLANDYWLQLAVYALALCHSSPHRDWPHNAMTGVDATKVRLVEANLLTNYFKEHNVDENDVVELEDFILDSAWEMGLLDLGKNYTQLEVGSFESARNPRSCQYCQFQRICW
jgi:hypothetical protein